MGEYVVSARKYRPASFDNVVGQSALTTTLKNAVKSGKLAHAYLFCGPRGVGKTTCARIFAKAINCLSPTDGGEACGVCESCKAFAEGRSYNVFELDAASNNSVENIKQLMEQTRIPPQVGKYKVFIIDEVHMLSTAAFNAFLKTLEEPPAHVLFILATTEKHKILPTILSRCQIYDFDRMSVAGIVGHLKAVAEKEGVSYEEEALHLIAEKADGGMRDALSIFDQAASFSQGDITYEKVLDDLNVLDSDNYFKIVDLAMENKVSEIMLLLDGVLARGFDAANVASGLAAHIRNVMMAKDGATLKLLETSEARKERYLGQASKCPSAFLYRALKILGRCDVNYKQSSNKRLLVELTLIEVAQITQPDEDGAAGRRPGTLKTLFRKKAEDGRGTAQQVAVAGNPGARQQGAACANTERQAPGANAQKAPARVSVASIIPTLSSLSGKGKEDEEEGEGQPCSGMAEPFTQGQLEKEWRDMCLRMDVSLRGLANRMANVIPRADSMPRVEIVVDNQLLQTQIENIKGRIRATLAAKLRNDGVEVAVRLAEKAEVRKLLTKRELFEEMKKANPEIARLADILKLELV